MLGDSKPQVAVVMSGAPTGGSVMKCQQTSSIQQPCQIKCHGKGDGVEGLGSVDWLGKPHPGR
jgi:hypothetical protein